jgi:hypothetical protein
VFAIFLKLYWSKKGFSLLKIIGGHCFGLSSYTGLQQIRLKIKVKSATPKFHVTNPKNCVAIWPSKKPERDDNKISQIGQSFN